MGVVVLIVVLLMFPGLLSLYTSIRVRAAEKAYPPAGQFVTVEGLRLHYVRQGSGRAVVLLHGNDGFVQDYTLTVLDRAGQEYDVIAFDRPGHGYSDRPATELPTPQVQARLIHGALQQLGIRKPVLVGHSWSGPLVLSYALQFPNDVTGVVVVSGGVYGSDDPGSPYDRLALHPVFGNLVLRTIWLPLAAPIIRQSLVAAYSPFPPGEDYVRAAQALWSRPRHARAAAQDNVLRGPACLQLAPHYPHVRVPVTILHGDSDLLVPVEVSGARLHRDIPGSTLTVLRGTGHEVPHTQPEAFLEAIRAAWNGHHAAPTLQRPPDELLLAEGRGVAQVEDA